MRSEQRDQLVVAVLREKTGNGWTTARDIGRALAGEPEPPSTSQVAAALRRLKQRGEVEQRPTRREDRSAIHTYRLVGR